MEAPSFGGRFVQRIPRACLHAAMLVASAWALACSSSTSAGNGPDHILVTPSFVSLPIAGSQQLLVVVYDAGNNAISNPAITYSSSDTTVARVSATGLVTAVNTGIAAVTVTSRPLGATVEVDVSGAATVKLTTPDTLFLTGSQTYQLVAVARDGAGSVMPSAPIIWASRDSTVVTVSSTGVVARRSAGTVYVIAASGLGRDSALVTVLVARVNIVGGGTPFATAVLSSSVGYVTLESAGQLQSLDLTAPGLSGTPTAVSVWPTSLALDASGYAYVGNQGSYSVSVVNTATGAVADTIPITGTPLALLVPPGDSLLLVGTDEGHVYIVRLATRAIVDSFPTAVTNSLVMRGDTTVFANELSPAGVVEYNLRTRQVVRTLPVSGVPQGMVVAPSGTTLYVANETGYLQFWDLTTGTLTIQTALPPAGGYGLARNPANGLLYVSTSYLGSRVLVVDPATKLIVRTILTGGTPRRISFTTDGLGIVANEQGWVDYIK